MSILSLNGVGMRYGAMTALTEIDLSVERGEFLTLLGPSGSGKTTVLNIVAGMITPTSGIVTIDGRDVTELAPSKRGLGMVFQNYALMPHMTVFENVAFPLRIRKVKAAEIKRRVTEVLELMQLPQMATRKPAQLSGGQQQRIALARCLVYNPAIILMDEPLGALDKRLREQIQLELGRLHAELGMTVLFVTHDQEEALTLSDRIVLMNNGRIVQQGSPAELYRAPRSIFAADFLGDANLIDAEVVEVGDTVRLRTSAGTSLVAAAGEPVRPGTKVKAMVRPENVEVHEPGQAPAADNMLDGVVESSILLGSFVKHYIRGEGQKILVKEIYRPGGRTLSPGAAVRLCWPRDHLSILPDET